MTSPTPPVSDVPSMLIALCRVCKRPSMSRPFCGHYPWTAESLQPSQDHTEQDVLVEASDGETEEEERQRRNARRERIGWAYVVHGRLPFIQSARLRGPFDKDWTNPWRGKPTSAPINDNQPHDFFKDDQVEDRVVGTVDNIMQAISTAHSEASVKDWLQDIPQNASLEPSNETTYTGLLESSDEDLQVVQENLDLKAWQAQMQKAKEAKSKPLKHMMKRKSNSAWLKTIEMKHSRRVSPRESSPAALADMRRTATTTTATKETAPRSISSETTGGLTLPQNSPVCEMLRVVDTEVGNSQFEQTMASTELAPRFRDHNGASVATFKQQNPPSHTRSPDGSKDDLNKSSDTRIDPVPRQTHNRSLCSTNNVEGMSSLGSGKARSLKSENRPIHDLEASRQNSKKNQLPASKILPGSVTYLDCPSPSIFEGLSQASKLARSALQSSHGDRHSPKDQLTTPYDLSDLLADDAESSKMAELLSSCIKIQPPSRSGAPQTSKRKAGSKRSGRQTQDLQEVQAEVTYRPLKKIRRSVNFGDVDSPGFTGLARERYLLRRAASHTLENLETNKIIGTSLQQPKEIEVKHNISEYSSRRSASRPQSQDIYELDAGSYISVSAEIDGIEVKDLMKQPFELGGVAVEDEMKMNSRFLADGMLPGPPTQVFGQTIDTLEQVDEGTGAETPPGVMALASPSEAFQESTVAVMNSSLALTASHHDSAPSKDSDISLVSYESDSDEEGCITVIVLGADGQVVHETEDLQFGSNLDQARGTVNDHIDQEAISTDPKDVVDETWEEVEVGSPTLSCAPSELVLASGDKDVSAQSLHEDSVQENSTDHQKVWGLQSRGSSQVMDSSGDKNDGDVMLTDKSTEQGMQSPWVKLAGLEVPSIPSLGQLDTTHDITQNSPCVFDYTPKPPSQCSDVSNTHRVFNEFEHRELSVTDSLPARFSTPEQELPALNTDADYDELLTPQQEQPMSFADLMTPSPVRNSGTNPTFAFDTQCLVEATLANPWASSIRRSQSNKSLKRVSFGPLPGSDSNDLEQEPQKREIGSKMTSPPPPPEAHRIVMEEDRFLGLLKDTPERREEYRQLQTPSQRSPGVSLMAEAFLNAEDSGPAEVWMAGVDKSLDIPHLAQSPFGGAAITEANIGGVIEEMDSFLEGWDVEHEIAKARKGVLA